MSKQSFTTKDWLKTRQLDPQTWAIDDHGEDICYLVCGDARCMLIDTGWGIGDLRSLVESLNPLPLTVINTHGHPDHTFGNYQFPEVTIAADDIPLVGDPPSLAVRSYIAEDILSPPLPEDFDVNTWTVGEPATLIPVYEGSVFDLGNRELAVFAVPGHSPGSIVLLDRQHRWIYSGDTLLPGTVWLQLPESLSVSGFRDSLMRLQEKEGEFDVLYPAHGALETLGQSASLLDDMVDGLGKILDGTLVGEPYSTFAGDGLRCDFGTCGVLYLPDRL